MNRNKKEWELFSVGVSLCQEAGQWSETSLGLALSSRQEAHQQVPGMSMKRICVSKGIVMNVPDKRISILNREKDFLHRGDVKAFVYTVRRAKSLGRWSAVSQLQKK